MFYANTFIEKFSRAKDTITFPVTAYHHFRGNVFTARTTDQTLQGRVSCTTRNMTYEDSGMALAVLQWLPSVGIVGATEVTFDIRHRLLSVPESRTMMADEMLYAAPTFNLKAWAVRIYCHNGEVVKPDLADQYLIPNFQVTSKEELEVAYQENSFDGEVLGLYLLEDSGLMYNLPIRRYLVVNIKGYDTTTGILQICGAEDNRFYGNFNMNMNLPLKKALFEEPSVREFQTSYCSLITGVDGKHRMFGLKFHSTSYDLGLDHQLCEVF